MTPAKGAALFEPYLRRWDLEVDGAPLTTRAAHLMPVRRHGEPAMLKIAIETDERRGGAIMAWWAGDGAARVLAHDESALLMERATGGRSLSAMARGGEDEEATRILCAAAARLHRPRPGPLPAPIPLAAWFHELAPAAARHGGILRRCAETAHELLATQRDIVVLHGDLHHDNVLDFGPRGWLAIDPKGLIGERGFDYANIFTNPDLADPVPPVAIAPGVFERRLQIVSEAGGLERERLLKWVFAWTGLSAAWFLGDGETAEIDFRIAQMAASDLDA